MRESSEDRLERLLHKREPLDRAGPWVDPKLPRRRIRVIERDVHERTGVEYLCVRDGGSGGGLWCRASQVVLVHPDDV